ncbi:RpiB/LacA/LacB family sugar-phosphate isomerase [Candidatus Marinimicrobia bacterium]|jgi:ribose 5-phosphate isomerase B|nr:RpiB/LacA/LacB family sugar-phosphate isomerase [bacterium]MDA7641567.1 RpiB/LacA/LacB family sugar-phosphate isomerase [Candidatus Neomarinimicrobiota bacterium]MDA7685725.1 RpiB/LacA/LacB family sugar-phosphate isomerase [Candidatus Neomarinimicrobiota bacterium]MDA9841864.1 RpiB/LacA/LacB family sugar-phosphate isomerase [Candidatus Neomarinimicrobiota bacterium]MDB3887828.1 RpiB/LacA/LacB family sugar-phosphate isomerase [Candidatus Neomarinimicrobiota bacterium]|tara:strand:- start:6980 stop:7429 length:450 start_codon:yes stop_codon:yes gene_type:complete
MDNNTIVLATDHAGFELKEAVKKSLLELGFEVKDFGALEYEPTDDYPDFINPAAKFISENDNAMGIIFGGSGQGEAMAANRFKGVRAAVFYDGPDEIINLSRLHNNANVLSFGSRFIDAERAKELIKQWLSVEFEGGRHQKRIEKLDSY